MKYTDLVNIISKPWVNARDISKLANCGLSNAIKIRNAIAKQIIDNGYKLPHAKSKIVPTKNALEYLGLDIEYIYKMVSNDRMCFG